MPPSPPQNLESLLSASDFEADIARRVQAMAERLSEPGSVPDYLADPENKKRFLSAREELTPVLRSVAAETTAFVCGLGVFLAFFCLFMTPLFLRYCTRDTILRALLFPIAVAALCILVQMSAKAWQKHKKRKGLFLHETLALSLPLLNHKSATEKAYCEAVAALLEGPSMWGGPVAVKSLLHDLRDLFQTGKQAATRRSQMEQTMSHQSLADVDAEAARLAERVSAVNDTHAREIFKQSLTHLEARRARMQALEPLRERLEAQEEAVFQVLREAQVTLSNTNFFGGSGLDTSGVDAAVELPAQWSETTQRLRQQMAAVEMAVQEVMGGGTQAARR